MSEAEWRAQEDNRRQEVLAQVGARIATRAAVLTVLIEELQEDIYTAMRAQGFWDHEHSGPQGNTLTVASKIALIHSELSEALEASRKGIMEDDHIPQFSGLEAELADTLIRILDLAGGTDLDLGGALVAKMFYNLRRPPKHGKAY